MTDYDFEPYECEACFGSGRDEGEWDGICIYCSGAGERYHLVYEDEDEEDLL